MFLFSYILKGVEPKEMSKMSSTFSKLHLLAYLCKKQQATSNHEFTIEAVGRYMYPFIIIKIVLEVTKGYFL